MTKQDWLTVGMKLIGVYFAILGLVSLCVNGGYLVVAGFSDTQMHLWSSGNYAMLIGVFQPIAYVVAAYYLTRKTKWCLKKICKSCEMTTAE